MDYLPLNYIIYLHQQVGLNIKKVNMVHKPWFQIELLLSSHSSQEEADGSVC